MLSRVRLTDAYVRRLRPAAPGKRYEISDVQTPGLIVRVTDQGRKSLMLRTRLREGARVSRLLLGVHDALTVDDARELARQYLATIRSGKHPRDVRPRVPDQRPVLFREVMVVYLERVVDKHRQGENTGRTIRRSILPAFGHRQLKDISRPDVIRFVEGFAHIPTMGHITFEILRSFLNWTVDRNLIEHSPAERVRASRLLGPRRVRQRLLSEDELRALFIETERFEYPFGPWARFIFLTGQRRVETTDMRWTEVDLERKTWTIPGSRHKSGIQHVVPLSRQAADILRSIPRGNGPFVWSVADGARPYHGFKRPKARLHRNMERRLGRPVEQWCWHDARRVVRSKMAELGVPPHIAEAALGHAQQGLERVYQQYRMLPEIRDAFQKYADHISGLLRRQEGEASARSRPVRAGREPEERHSGSPR